MQTVFIIQHCQALHHVDPSKKYPDRGNGLTPFGRRQAQALADRLCEWFKGKDISLHSSDMMRAQETAGIIGSSLGCDPILHAELREWSDPKALERESSPSFRRPEEGESIFDWRPYPERETWREFHARVSDFMAKLLPTVPPDSVPVLVVHGGTLSNIVVWWLGIPLDILPELTCFAASPGSLSILQRNQYGNPVVERLNDRSHLLALDLQEHKARPDETNVFP